MTKVTFFKSGDNYKGFVTSGHSGFDRRGRDIVCSAISILTINTVNSIEALTDTPMRISTEEGIISCMFDDGYGDKASVLIDSYILGLKSIVEKYGDKYLQLEFQEI